MPIETFQTELHEPIAIVRASLIQAYGLFWHSDEIDWNDRANGSRSPFDPGFELLGRRGNVSRLGALKLADFRKQRGLYLLYGNYGLYYVGVTTQRDLGVRLREHTRDDHRDKWERFSWFGFCTMQAQPAPFVPAQCATLDDHRAVVLSDMIKQMEALLIHAMSPRNKHMDPGSLINEEWKQCTRSDKERLSLAAASRAVAYRATPRFAEGQHGFDPNLVELRSRPTPASGEN